MPFPYLTLAEIEAADAAGVKLEITEGLPTWEFHPLPRHQIVLQAILRSIRLGPNAGGCACFPITDVLIKFPDGSLKRPDLSIFCEAPKELDEAITSVPSATVEVVSADSRKKDLELNPPFYLKHGLLDVLVVEPLTSDITWFTREGQRVLRSPQTVELQCGCVIDL
jgi:Uma2 family endonuclease